jgi:hypothetical protein
MSASARKFAIVLGLLTLALQSTMPAARLRHEARHDHEFSSPSVATGPCWQRASRALEDHDATCSFCQAAARVKHLSRPHAGLLSLAAIRPQAIAHGYLVPPAQSVSVTLHARAPPSLV